MQTRTGGEHPARENAFDLALKRDFVHLDECISIGRFGRWARVADPRSHLQRAELHRFANCGIEADDAAVILSSPENTAREFSIFCVGISVITVSSGWGEVSAGCGGGIGPGNPGPRPDRDRFCGTSLVRRRRPVCGAITGFTAAPTCAGGGGKGAPDAGRRRSEAAAGGGIAIRYCADEVRGNCAGRRDTAPVAAAGEMTHSEHWPADAAANRRKSLQAVPAPVPQRAFRRAGPIGRRYGAWNPGARSGLPLHRVAPG